MSRGGISRPHSPAQIPRALLPQPELRHVLIISLFWDLGPLTLREVSSATSLSVHVAWKHYMQSICSPSFGRDRTAFSFGSEGRKTWVLCLDELLSVAGLRPGPRHLTGLRESRGDL